MKVNDNAKKFTSNPSKPFTSNGFRSLTIRAIALPAKLYLQLTKALLVLTKAISAHPLKYENPPQLLA
ncbi:hypothetical protein [Paraburkholderia heleia]|uniref:hypothetical protein n=1 Tax=Paraburkholderia heleia TaxID=634127 RepID=UPI002AB73365|nr:hypothetical protein [Paraburkholderia heleia]